MYIAAAHPMLHIPSSHPTRLVLVPCDSHLTWSLAETTCTTAISMVLCLPSDLHSMTAIDLAGLF